MYSQNRCNLHMHEQLMTYSINHFMLPKNLDLCTWFMRACSTKFFKGLCNVFLSMVENLAKKLISYVLSPNFELIILNLKYEFMRNIQFFLWILNFYGFGRSSFMPIKCFNINCLCMQTNAKRFYDCAKWLSNYYSIFQMYSSWPRNLNCEW